MPDGAAWITASMAVKCSRPPRSHRMVLQLEKHKGRDWIVMASSRPDLRIPDATGKQRWTVTFDRCDDAGWRVRMRISGTSHDGTAFKVNEVTSQVRVRCPK
ncbi:hypothetical protein [Actinomadura sp. 6N118]|uniref:hypothetical protein n=1 Tax=Actinomadura sp. 6N118 TaxID=3375151 RepID=UPI0037BDE8AE